MPLTMTGAGETATIRRVGGNSEVRHHLENLGFVEGSNVTVVSVVGGQRDCECKRVQDCHQQGDGK